MKMTTTSAAALTSQGALTSAVAGAWEMVGQSFDQFCLLAGFSAPGEMMEADVTALAGEAHTRDTDKPGYRWGRTCGRLGFHGGKVELERPRVRPKLHAWVRHVLKRAWKLDDADKAERLPRNLARRLELEAPGVSRAILEGLDKILTVIRPGIPPCCDRLWRRRISSSR